MIKSKMKPNLAFFQSQCSTVKIFSARITQEIAIPMHVTIVYVRSC